MVAFYLTKEMIAKDIAIIAMSDNKEKFVRSLKKASVSILNGNQVAQELYFLYLDWYNKVCGIPFLRFPEYRSGLYDKHLGEMLKAYREWILIAKIEDQKILNAVEDCIAKNKNNCQLPIGNWTDYIGNRNRFQVVQLQKAVKEMTEIVVKIYYYYGLEELDGRQAKSLYQGMVEFLKNRVKESLSFNPPKDFWGDKHFPDASVVEDFFHWTKIVRPAPLKDFDCKVEFFSSHDQEKIEKAFLRFL